LIAFAAAAFVSGIGPSATALTTAEHKTAAALVVVDFMVRS
jgi:hypothetical protein